MNLADVTLIVPTKNEARNIGRFLAAVPPGLQVIIVDASTDGTCRIIRQMGRCRTLILCHGGNVAAARQMATQCARTEWLIFSDADVVFAEDYFAQLAKTDVEEEIGGIIGAKLSRDRYQWYYRLFSLWLCFLCRAGIPAASGSNLLIRRRVLMHVGGFDLRLSCNEDSELTWRIRRHGYRIRYEGGLKVYEFDHRRLDRGVLRKTLHSLARCTLLFCGLMGNSVRNHDWGYWEKRY